MRRALGELCNVRSSQAALKTFRTTPCWGGKCEPQILGQRQTEVPTRLHSSSQPCSSPPLAGASGVPGGAGPAPSRRAQVRRPGPPHTLHPAPYTLHPAPCTLRPTPYNLHPTPYTLHPAPCTLHPTPCTLHPTPYNLHPTPYWPCPMSSRASALPRSTLLVVQLHNQLYSCTPTYAAKCTTAQPTVQLYR